MILDNTLVFSDGQAITTSTTSTNVVDLLNARDMGIGDNPAIKLLALVTTAFTTDSTNASTLQITVQGSTNSTNSGFVNLAASAAYAAADLTAGRKIFPIDFPVLMNGQAMPRYIRLGYTSGVASWSTGALLAALVLDREDNPIYPKNYDASYPLS